MSRPVQRQIVRLGALGLIIGATCLMHLYLRVWERVKKRTIFAVY